MFDYVLVDDLAVATRRVGGLGSPAPRSDVHPRTSRHGAVDLTRFYEARVITLDGVIKGTPAAAWTAFDALEAKLQLGAARTLTFRRPHLTEDEQVLVQVASPVDASIDYDKPGVIEWGVSLLAPDPRIYGAVLRSGTYDPAASLSGGGVTFPLTFPLTFSTTTATHLELINAGNTKTPPVLTISGPVTNPTLDNDTTGESIALACVLGANDTVVVDVAERSVELNGAARLDFVDVPNTEWWEMAPGTNRIRARGAGMSVGTTEFTCQYRNARI
jgi:hypothetical protein